MMNGLEFHERLKPVVAWLEKQPRHTLAFLLAQHTFLLRMFPLALGGDGSTFEQSLAGLRHDVEQTRGMSRMVLANRRAKRMIDRLDAGLPIGPPRRKRRRRKS